MHEHLLIRTLAISLAAGAMPLKAQETTPPEPPAPEVPAQPVEPAEVPPPPEVPAVPPTTAIQANPPGPGVPTLVPPNPAVAAEPVRPALPADPGYQAGPYKGALTSPPPEALNKVYPVCTRTLRDSCRNPGGR